MIEHLRKLADYYSGKGDHPEYADGRSPAIVTTLTQAADEVAALRERLEIAWATDIDGNRIPFPEGMPDGIACRDETIRQQDAQITLLQRSHDQLAEQAEKLDAEAQRYARTVDERDAQITALREALRGMVAEFETDIAIGQRDPSHALLRARKALGVEGTQADEYRRPNPLGGPAKMFEVMALRIRAGETFEDVLADYGLRSVDSEPLSKSGHSGLVTCGKCGAHYAAPCPMCGQPLSDSGSVSAFDALKDAWETFQGEFYEAADFDEQHGGAWILNDSAWDRLRRKVNGVIADSVPERFNGLAPPAIVSCGVCVNTGKVNGEVCPYCKGETATPAAGTENG